MKNYLVTWFYAEKKDDESFYPSVGSNTSSPEFQTVYWRCVYDFFKSAILTQKNSNTSYLFFTNVSDLPADIDGLNFSEFFRENGIEVVLLELSTKTPKDWYGAWRNQFYLFDILKYLRGREGNFLILDSDIFFTKDLSGVFDDISENGIIEYDNGASDDWVENGVSNLQMRSLYTEFYGKENNSVRYKCGEIIGIRSSLIPDIVEEFETLWEKNYRQYEKGALKLNEEAHFLSVIYERLGLQNSLANQYIKRMWSAAKYDNIENSDVSFAMWHLPAEKKYAFREMYRFLLSCDNEDKYLARLRRAVHLPGSRAVRRFLKAVKKTAEKISGK